MSDYDRRANKELLEQIFAVASDNRADSCDHGMALNFIRSVLDASASAGAVPPAAGMREALRSALRASAYNEGRETAEALEARLHDVQVALNAALAAPDQTASGAVRSNTVLNLIERVKYKEPNGASERGWNDACDHISKGVERLTPPGLDPVTLEAAAIIKAWNDAREPYSMVLRVDTSKPTQIKNDDTSEIVHTGTQEGCFQWLDNLSAAAVIRALASGEK